MFPHHREADPHRIGPSTDPHTQGYDGEPENERPALFNGESSDLMVPREPHWLFLNGYTYVESFPKKSLSFVEEGIDRMPKLFMFFSADEFRFEAYFHGQFLVVENYFGKGCTFYLYKPQCWYFVVVEHGYKLGFWGRQSELRLYVDGNMHKNRPFDFLRVSKLLALWSIGTNLPPSIEDPKEQRGQCFLFVEMDILYYFKEPIKQGRMACLAAQGGNVLPCFGSGACSQWLATNEHARNIAEESCKLNVVIE